jgi:hypothetical protein
MSLDAAIVFAGLFLPDAVTVSLIKHFFLYAYFTCIILPLSFDRASHLLAHPIVRRRHLIVWLRRVRSDQARLMVCSKFKLMVGIELDFPAAHLSQL